MRCWQMDSSKKDIMYLNISLNRKKERSAIIMNTLEKLPKNSRNDFIKTAILHYIQHKNNPEIDVALNDPFTKLLKDSMQEVLLENGLINAIHSKTNDSDELLEKEPEIEETDVSTDAVMKANEKTEEPMKKAVNKDKLAKLAKNFTN